MVLTAAATVLAAGAGIAEVKALSIGGAWAYFTTDLVDQSVRASLLFASAGCFERVVRSSGRDISNLLARRPSRTDPINRADDCFLMTGGLFDGILLYQLAAVRSWCESGWLSSGQTHPMQPALRHCLCGSHCLVASSLDNSCTALACRRGWESRRASA